MACSAHTTPAGVDRRGHFRAVGDITTAQLFGLKSKQAADGGSDGVHVPLMAVPHDVDADESFAETLDESSDAALWDEGEPDERLLDSWRSFGFSAAPAGGGPSGMCAPSAAAVL